MSAQADELKRIAELIVPPGAVRMGPPAVSRRASVGWDDFQRFVDALDETMGQPMTPLLERLLRALFWVRIVDESTFDEVLGQRLREFLQLVTQAARSEVQGLLIERIRPSRAGRLQFRMLAAQYARKDTLAESSGGWRRRVQLLRAALRFARGGSSALPLQEGFREVPFHRLEDPFGEIGKEAESILTRYFRVKIQGLHFCGPAYYGVPFVEGFYSLALVFPVVLWLARWLAAGESRDCLTTQDVAKALAIADHHHGYSPVFGSRSSRRRVRLLAMRHQIDALCAWYAR